MLTVVNERAVALALTWASPLSPGERNKNKLLRSLGLRRGDSKIYGIYDQKSNTVGVLNKKSVKNQKIPRNLLSLAKWIAVSDTAAQIIHVRDVGDGQQWFCATNHGLVIPGMDIVTNDGEEIKGLIGLAQKIMPKVELSTFLQLSDNEFTKTLSKHCKKAEIHEMTGYHLKVALISLFLVITALTSIYFIFFRNTQKSATSDFALMSHRASMFRETKEKEHADFVKLPTIYDVSKLLLEQLDHRPEIQNGWMLKSIAYTTTNNRLRITWRRDTAMNSDNLKSLSPHAVLSFDGNNAVVDGHIKIRGSGSGKSSVITISKFIRQAMMLKNTMLVHQTKFFYAIPKLKTSKYRVATKTARENHWKIGVWSMSGIGLYALDNDANAVAVLGKTVVDSLIVQLGTNIKWQAKGEYFVKN